jgi:ankyrin repeat protein
MPEEHEGQHEATAQSLQTDSSFFELSISLYMFSNDIPLINYSKKSLPTPSDNRRNEFMVIRNILRKAKLDDAENMKSLLASQDLTTEVIAHKIFRASVEMRDNEMMRIMLEAGMWPDAPLLIDKFHGTALQHISGMLPREVACGLARILLSHGASTDPKNAGEPPLARAIDSDNTALFNLLVAHGAKPSPQALRMAVSRKSWVKIIIPYFQMLYDAGVDLKSTTVDGKTLLGIAKDDVLTKWLVDHGCDVNAPQICELQNDSYEWVNHITSPLGIAAADGKLAVMRVLLEAGANINSPPGANVSVSPLFLAVYSSEINSVRFLIQAGANIESADQFKMLHEATRKTLIERAWHRQDLCLALLRSGAYASSNEKMNILHFPMIMAVRARDSTLARDLLSLGAPINPFDRRSSITAIALAIMNGDIEMISLLKDSGASIGGLEIPSVHDVRTAEYLESVGWLPEILSWNRAQILASAIGRYDETLVSFLLQVGKDRFTSVMTAADLTERESPPLESGSLGLDSSVSHPLKSGSLGSDSARFQSSESDSLESAIQNNDITLARFLISQGTHVNESDISMIVLKAGRGNDESGFLDLLRMAPRCHTVIPTAFGMAILFDNCSVVDRLLEFQFSPKGRPIVLFDSNERRIITSRAENFVSMYGRISQWRETNRSFGGSVKLLNLDSVLEIATLIGNRAILQTLLHLDVWTSQEKGLALLEVRYSNPIDHGKITIFEDMVRSGADINQTIKSCRCTTYKKSTFPCTRPLFYREPLYFHCMGKCPSLNALVIAMDRGSIEFSRRLIDMGCDVNAKLGEGVSPLLFSTFHTNSDLTKLLLRSGAVEAPSGNDSALLRAVIKHDKELVNLFLNPEIFSKMAHFYTGRRGERVLLGAIKSNDFELVDLLLKAEIGLRLWPKPALPSLPDDALSIATNGGNYQIISALLRIADADVKRRSYLYGRALPVAIRKKNCFLTEALIEKGADVNVGSVFHERALTLAVYQKDCPLVKILVEKGAEVNLQSNFHETVLHRAVLDENSPIVELLIKNGADVNIRSDFCDTAFHIAINRRNYSVAKLLIAGGANTNMRSDFGGTVLQMAVKEKDHRLVRFLIENGTDVNLQSVNGRTALQEAAARKDYVLVGLLIENGADVDLQSDRDGTLLQFAFKQQDYRLANILIKDGAYLHDPPSPVFGNSALQMASEQGQTDLVSLLLEKGADPNQSPLYDSGATALQFAAIMGVPEIVRKLIEAGAAVDAPGSILYGRTAIEGAAEWGQINILYFLVKKGSSPTGSNRRQYLRAVKLAETQGHYPVARFLRDWIRWTDFDELNYAMEVFDDEEASLIKSEEEQDFEYYEDLMWS